MKHSQIPVEGGSLHVVETEDEHGTAVLFLHGWPEDWSAWSQVMELATEHVHALAVDLPGIGGSLVSAPPATTHDMADMLFGVISKLAPRKLAIVGHDIGGQVAYAYLMRHAYKLDALAIMNVAVPGVPPWEDVLRNPSIWHFAFHAVPDLPELLVHGKEGPYFDFFYEALTKHPDRISSQARATYASAYARPEALRAGFGWYRAFPEDAAHNKAQAENSAPIDTPVLYLRGRAEGGHIAEYLSGFRHSGIRNIRGELIDDCGHFAPEEQPARVWNALLSFFEESGIVPKRGRS